MNFLYALPFIIAALLLMRWMDRTWGKTGKFVEIMRFPGNDKAQENYDKRAEAGGHKARLVR
jgi:hypothetical protein